MRRLSVAAAICAFVLCTIAAVSATAQTQAEDLAAARAAMSDQNMPAANKLALVAAYLDKYPPDRNSGYLVSFAARLLVRDLGKPAEGLALVRQELERVADEPVANDLRQTYIYICGLAGDMQSLEAFETELRQANLYEGMFASSFASAAFDAKEYSRALVHLDAALAEATPEAIAVRFKSTPDNARVLDWLAWYRGRLLTQKAWCLVQIERTAEALPILQEAVEKGQRNFLGLVNGDALHYLGVALAKLGRTDEAMPHLVLDGIIGGNRQSTAVLKDLFTARDGSLDGFESFAESERRRLAKPAPDFTLPLESGESFSLASLRGKVILLDFWFPT